MEDQIKGILKNTHDQTTWGICQDVMELTEIKARACAIIESAQAAILTIEKFVKRYGHDPDTPKEEE